jgi:DNA-binding MarR family transcriptional regulator
MDVTQKKVCEDVLRLLESFKKAMADLADEYGITRIQLFAIYSIHKSAELPMGKVADVLHCDPSNVTGIVDRLVAQKLIMRHECESDRRSKLLRLTPEGKRVVASLQAALPDRLGCSRLDAAESQAFHELIQKIYE